MIFSYNWLKTYFEQSLPSAQDLEQGIIFHSFEVEGVEEKDGDKLLDIKVLPDRAHDCLCHYGIAGEISAIFNQSKRELSTDYGLSVDQVVSIPTQRSLSVRINDPELCRRYIGRVVEGVKVGPSPDWLRGRLEAIGQRSINNIVDATNYVMFDIGQPMHAFDADKVVGGIVVRRAQVGERITTLDGKEIELDDSVLIIADEAGPLAIAGIKGGNRAEVDNQTQNIILESANFHPSRIRRTSAKIGLRTDASKRFENELSPDVAREAMDRLSCLIGSLNDDVKIGEVIDQYPAPITLRQLEINPAEISARLGIDVPAPEAERILNLLEIKTEKNGETWNLTIPYRRVDIQALENIVEEVGRIYGYDKIVAKTLSADFSRIGEKPGAKRYRVMNKIREVLLDQGFSEVYGYSFAERGEVAVANPIALDKPFLRPDLHTFIEQKIGENILNALFDTEPVRLFEFGNVFHLAGDNIVEDRHLVVALGYKKRKKIDQNIILTELENCRQKLAAGLGIKDLSWEVISVTQQQNNAENLIGLVELKLNDLVDLAGDFSSVDLSNYLAPTGTMYRKLSSYPKVIRDVAVWVPANIKEDEVATLIAETAGPLLTEGPVRFDRFEKDGKVSLAFRSVFQSYDKTLSDDEVNEVWGRVTSALAEKGWEVR